MKIYFSKDVRNGEMLTINELKELPSEAEVLNFLVCPNCSCNLSFYPEGTKIAYLKTKNGQKHSLDCEHYFEVETQKNVSKLTGSIIYVLNTIEKRARANDLYRDFLKEEGNGGTQRQEATSRKNKPSKRIDQNTKRDSKLKILLSSNPDEPNAVKSNENMSLHKNVRLPRRKPDTLSIKDIGKTVNIIGYLESISISSNYAEIVISHNKQFKTIRLQESVFRTSAANYDEILNFIKSYFEKNGNNIVVVATVEVLLKQEQLALNMYEDDGLFFNNKRAVWFAATCSQEENHG